jgi:hypothetical protein
VHAIILASVGLSGDVHSKEGKPIAASKAYFISDGNDMLFLHSLIIIVWSWNM